MRYSALPSIVFVLALAGCFAGCRQPRHPPSDFRAETLDVRSAVQTADSIVLAYPVERKEVRKLSASRVDDGPLKLIETETTLVVLCVFKGQAPLKQIRFRHYQRNLENDVLIGPPQGPSGNVGVRGIFFLRRQATGMFRSVVDIYRPDIVTPWILDACDAGSCSRPSECISRFLLTFRPNYNRDVFLAQLRHNVRFSLLLVGPMDVFELLNKLSAQAGPRDVKERACRELSQRYKVFQPPCQRLMAGSPAEEEYRNTVAGFRERLRRQGLIWAQAQLETKDESEVRRYLEVLSRSSDSETRKIAESLLNSQKAVPKP